MKVLTMVLFIIAAVLLFFAGAGLLFLGDLVGAVEEVAGEGLGSGLLTLTGVLYFAGMIAAIFGATKCGKKEGTIAGLVVVIVVVIAMLILGGFPTLLFISGGGALVVNYLLQTGKLKA